MDAKHGKPGTSVCTVRHGTGRRWIARWVDHNGQERTKAFDRKVQDEDPTGTQDGANKALALKLRLKALTR